MTENSIAYYSYILGKETKELMRWTSVTGVHKTANWITFDTISVSTRDTDYYFGKFRNAKDAYRDISKLADLTMRKLIDSGTDEPKSLGKDLELLNKPRRKPNAKSNFLQRELYARQKTEEFRLKFQLPNNEKLDGLVWISSRMLIP